MLQLLSGAVLAAMWAFITGAVPIHAGFFESGELRPEPVAAPAVQSKDARSSTYRQLQTALGENGLLHLGRAWIGKTEALGEYSRDTIIYVPHHLDLGRPVELIIYMDGYDSFSARTIRRRHARGIARLVASPRNFVYVAPDVPTTAHGRDPRHRGPYWSARCEHPARSCRGMHAPGDFVGFYREVTARVESMLDGTGETPDYTLTLIGFSNGGKGIQTAVRQLVQSTGPVDLEAVELRRVVFADAIYSRAWLTDTWEWIRELPTLDEVTLLLIDADRGAPGRHNREVAARFVRTYRPDPGLLRVETLVMRHEAIGDAAVYYRPEGDADVVAGP